MLLSVIIPAYNEEKRIRNTILTVNDYLIKQYYDYEIIVVNDGSTDNTAKVIADINSNDAKLPLSIINNKKNLGKGFSVRRGLLKGRGSYRLFLDADNSTSIKEIEKIFSFTKQGYDIVIGSRSMKGANIISAQPWQRKILGDLYRLLTVFFAGLHGFHDTQCGFKIFSAESVEKIFPKCRINGWSFDVEILLMAEKLGYSVKEVPIKWSDSLGSKVKIGGMISAIFDLLRIRWYMI